MSDNRFLKTPISNGNPVEQALIRRWWVEEMQSRGRLVFEFHLEGKYADAIWFPDAESELGEQDGKLAPARFPIAGEKIVLCEAKRALTPEVIGQALVYRAFATWSKAEVVETIVFAETASDSMRRAAAQLGLSVVVEPAR